MQSRTLLVVGIKQLVTLAGPPGPRAGPAMRELGIVDNGAMLAKDGRIATVGARSEVEQAAPSGAAVVDAGGRLVTPGLVDAHSHLVFAGCRADEFERRCEGASYSEIAAGGGGIRSTVGKTRAATEEELVRTAKRYADWMLRCGTTTAEAKSGYGLTVEDERKILRVIRALDGETPMDLVPTFLGAHAVPEEFEGDPDGYVESVVLPLLPEVASERLAEFCDVFCEEGYFDVEASRKVLSAAKELGLGLRVHADQLSNGGGAILAAELGAKTADHLEHTDSEGIRALVEARVQPVLLPGSVYALGHSRYPAAREMIDSGLAVVLATDFNPGSSPTPSQPAIMSLACTQMRMTPAEVLCATTWNAACSLGRESQIGSLGAGKRADFVLWDAEDFRELPCFFGIELARTVFKDAVQVFER